jgi:hypothetical protein
MRNSNYQDTITTPLSREHDHNATDDNGIDDITADLDADTDVADGVLPAIEKVGITLFVPIELNNNLSSFGRLSKLYAQVLNVVNHGCVRSSLRSWKEAGFQRNRVPPSC